MHGFFPPSQLPPMAQPLRDACPSPWWKRLLTGMLAGTVTAVAFFLATDSFWWFLAIPAGILFIWVLKLPLCDGRVLW